jgi:hypothetical protein
MVKRRLVYFIIFFIQIAFSQHLVDKKNLVAYQGFFNFYLDTSDDKIYLEVDELEKEFLYVYSLSSGVGSNDIGLDRGQLGNEQVVYFKKAGNKLLLIQPNLAFRANTNNSLEKKSVNQAFAKSVLYGFPIKETKGKSHFIDITKFLMTDAHGVARQLQLKGQGKYILDASKSALALERTKAFPKNNEFEALLTFSGNAKSSQIRSVSPNPNLVSVIQHKSFIALPDASYKKRAYDTRSGALFISYMDYATPVQEAITKRFITRHRLEKKYPNEAVSEAKEPIVYYLDNGTPEPIRSALLDGGKWWNQAFEAIGYKNAFQVKILPDDADPMDVRYNVIQWVHRATRGWSYGRSIVDPRTGEILKGHVSLGSLRIRQDFLIAQALMNKPFAARDDNYKPMLDLALARIRQLSAHEIGHTLGFAHNFASSINNRASVMDYPHPQFSIENGEIDFQNAYATGIGKWDKVTVAYAYSDFNDSENEMKFLNEILDQARKDGLRYISDRDARPKGGAHALAHLWDNGNDPSMALDNILKVRALAIEHFSADNIRSYEPYSMLEDVFVPLYFFHRYQTEATSKLIGGLDYNYAVKNDTQLITATIAPELQRAALAVLLKTLNTATLTIPEEKLNLFPPRANGYSRTRESFKSSMGVAFDPLSASATASDMTLGVLLHPERASRLIQQKSRNTKQLGLVELIDALFEATLLAKNQAGYSYEIQQMINHSVLKHVMNLAASTSVVPQVNAIARHKLKELKQVLAAKKAKGLVAIYNQNYCDEIAYFLKNPKTFKAIASPKIPDGSPIGMSCFEYN